MRREAITSGKMVGIRLLQDFEPLLQPPLQAPGQKPSNCAQELLGFTGGSGMITR